MMVTLQDRYRGALLGLACGDAVGATFEGRKRDTFMSVDMVGGGPFKLDAGQWTDDTSMALCLAESLIECKGYDPLDQMNRYVKWYTWGYMSSTGKCFGTGKATRDAIAKFLSSDQTYAYMGSKDDAYSGNGSIMRLAPIVMWAMKYYDIDDPVPRTNFYDFVQWSSRVTHASEKCIQAVNDLATTLVSCFHNKTKEQIIECYKEYHFSDIDPINKTRDEISGSGYVVNCIEAALWCFFHTESFEEAVLTAVNLGDDTDTTAAVVGQIAGAYYGHLGIPEKWRTTLQEHDMMVRMSDELLVLIQEVPDYE